MAGSAGSPSGRGLSTLRETLCSWFSRSDSPAEPEVTYYWNNPLTFLHEKRGAAVQKLLFRRAPWGGGGCVSPDPVKYRSQWNLGGRRLWLASLTSEVAEAGLALPSPPAAAAGQVLITRPASARQASSLHPEQPSQPLPIPPSPASWSIFMSHF